MDSPVHLLFRYSEQDFVRAMRAHYAARLRVRLDVVVALATAACGIYLWRSPESRMLGIFLVGLSATLALILVLAFAILPAMLFRREPKLRDEYALTFSSEGIHFRIDHIDSQLQWSLYNRALIDDYSFLLYYGTGSFSIIPKRVFHTTEQRTEFRELVAKKIPEICDKAKRLQAS